MKPGTTKLLSGILALITCEPQILALWAHTLFGFIWQHSNAPWNSDNTAGDCREQQEEEEGWRTKQGVENRIVPWPLVLL